MPKTHQLKKGIGERFTSILDELDLIIIFKLYACKKIKIMDLTRSLKQRHKTLKSHLEKLSKYKIINITPIQRNSKLITLESEMELIVNSHENYIRGWIR